MNGLWFQVFLEARFSPEVIGLWLTEPAEAQAKDAGMGWGKGHRMGQLPLPPPTARAED